MDKYNKAIEIAKNIYGASDSKDILSILETIFPELKESEDEKIRQFLIREVTETSDEIMSYRNMNKKDVLAWLEKQKVLTTEEDLQGKEDVLWCIKQAQKHAKDENEMGTCWFAEKWLEKQGEQKPIFEMKTPEESLGIDSDTYNKIVDECIYGEQKPAENKGMNLVEEKMTPFQKKVFCIVDTTIEEEQGLSNICNELLALAIQEIKQKSAWSKEDKEQLDRAIYMMEQLDMTNSWDDVYNWLKSLKDRVQPQTTWKPSEEMLEALYRVIPEFTMNKSEDEMLLDKLYQGLKYGKVLSEK